MAKKQFKAESKRLLDLMINSIYTHKEISPGADINSNAVRAIAKLCYSPADVNVGQSGRIPHPFFVDKDARTVTSATTSSA